MTFRARVRNSGTVDIFVHVVFIVYNWRGEVVVGAVTTTTAVEGVGHGPAKLAAQWLTDPAYVAPGTYVLRGTVYYSQDGLSFAAGNSLDTTFNVR